MKPADKIKKSLDIYLYLIIMKPTVCLMDLSLSMHKKMPALPRGIMTTKKLYSLLTTAQPLQSLPITIPILDDPNGGR